MKFTLVTSLLLNLGTGALRLMPSTDGETPPNKSKGEWLPKGTDGKIGHNPAITPLPESVRGELNQKFPGAFYLLVHRHPKGLPIRLLSEDFRELAIISNNVAHGKDARLFTHNGKIILTWVTNKGGANPKLAAQEMKVTTTGAHLVGPQKSMSGKNYGLMTVNGTLKALTWLRPETEVKDVQMNAAMDKCTTNIHPVETNMEFWGGESPHSTGMFKNSINPILLPDGKQYLGVMHMYDSHRKYYQYFVLFEAQAPFAATHKSDAFCIPSPEEAMHGGCENIQFVMSGTLIDSDSEKGKDVVLTFGVNDERSAMVRMPLKAVLEWTKTGSVLAAPSLMKIPHTNETQCLENLTHLPMVAKTADLQM